MTDVGGTPAEHVLVDGFGCCGIGESSGMSTEISSL
jgi:hypothetical protein